MAVQKSKKSRSRRDMRRSHHAISNPALSVDSTTGETHLRHRMTADGFYRGRQVIADRKTDVEENDSEDGKDTDVVKSDK